MNKNDNITKKINIEEKKHNNFMIKKELTGIKPLIKIIELTLQTAFLKPYSPNSLLIIAKPESAKTSSMQPFIIPENNWIYYTNEITSKMLIDNVMEKAKDKKIRFLMIPDLLNCIEKQKSSRQQFLNLIKSSIEEGVSNIQTYYKKIESKEPIKIGFITAITQDNFNSSTGIRKYLESTGILSRFIPFSYKYPIEKIKLIFDYIEGKNIKTDKLLFRKISVNDEMIKGDSELFKELELLSMHLGNQYKSYGIRTQERLQNLCKANAKINGRKKVMKEDIKEIFELSKWINFDFNNI